MLREEGWGDRGSIKQERGRRRFYPPPKKRGGGGGGSCRNVGQRFLGFIHSFGPHKIVLITLRMLDLHQSESESDELLELLLSLPAAAAARLPCSCDSSSRRL